MHKYKNCFNNKSAANPVASKLRLSGFSHYLTPSSSVNPVRGKEQKLKHFTSNEIILIFGERKNKQNGHSSKKNSLCSRVP